MQSIPFFKGARFVGLVAWLLGVSACYSPLADDACEVLPSCPGLYQCQEGACRCLPPYHQCLEECVDVQSDPSHCGACGLKCAATKRCESGRCVESKPPPGCPPGFRSCEGRCVELQSDPQHCGGCGVTCAAGRVCSRAQCSCPPTHQLCGQSCVELRSDAKHCGACHRACPQGQGCCQGQCSASASPLPEVCDGIDNNCDGTIDEGCDCTPGESRACYSGPQATRKVGLCQDGQQSCGTSGKWGTCLGEVLPGPEGCDGKDHNCDGRADPACPQHKAWLLSGGGFGEDRGLGLTWVANDGLYLLAQSKLKASYQSLSFTPTGLNQLVLLKLDEQGKFLWSVPAGAEDPYLARGQLGASKAGELLLSSHFVERLELGGNKLQSRGGFDAFLASLSPQGKVRWVTAWGGPGKDGVSGHAIDGQGDIYVTGHFRAAIRFGAQTIQGKGPASAYLAKFSAQGQALWIYHLGSPHQPYVHRPVLDSQGQIWVAGEYRSSLTTGSKTYTSAGDYDVFVARFDPQGKLLGLQSWGGPDGDGVEPPQAGPGGSVWLAGTFRHSMILGKKKRQLQAQDDDDIFLARLDGQGDLMWVLAGGGTNDDWLHSFVLNPQGQAFLLGVTDQGLRSFGSLTPAPKGKGLFMAQVDPGGKAVYLSSAQGDLWPKALVVDGQGFATFGGDYQNRPQVAGKPLPASQQSDVFLARLDPKGGLASLHILRGDRTEGLLDLCVGNAGQLYATGTFQLTVTAGPLSAQARLLHGREAFVWKLLP